MPNFPNGQNASWYAADFAAAQTDTVLVAAPGAAFRILLLGWKASTDTAQPVVLEDGTATLIDKSYLAANSTVVAPMGSPAAANSSYEEGVLLSENSALTVTTTAAGNASVGVLYRVVAA